MRVELAAAVLAVALVLPAAANAGERATAYATVAVPVANVWEAPNTATIPNDYRVWPTSQVTYDQRIGLVGHMPTQVLYGERVITTSVQSRPPRGWRQPRAGTPGLAGRERSDRSRHAGQALPQA